MTRTTPKQITDKPLILRNKSEELPQNYYGILSSMNTLLNVIKHALKISIDSDYFRFLLIKDRLNSDRTISGASSALG